jgi:hypothetical protein
MNNTDPNAAISLLLTTTAQSALIVLGFVFVKRASRFLTVAGIGILAVIANVIFAEIIGSLVWGSGIFYRIYKMGALELLPTVIIPFLLVGFLSTFVILAGSYFVFVQGKTEKT